MGSDKIIINQPAMLGDLLFIEPIIRYYCNLGKTVIWAIKDQYYWLNEYIKHDGLEIVKQSEFDIDYECAEFKQIEGVDYIPLRFATPIFRKEQDKHSGEYHEHFMLDKYRLLGLRIDMWKELHWERNYSRESILFNHLKIKEGEKYVLVNKFFKDIYEPQTEMNDLKFDCKVVEMRPIAGFTLLDWTKIVIQAEQIHTVETALIYVVEALMGNLKASEIHMYPRLPYQTGFGGVKNFISKNWILHDTN